MGIKSRRIFNLGFQDSSDGTESYQWSPTQEQVDAYIRSLEWQTLQKDISIPSRHTENRGAAGRNRRLFAFSCFFWGLIALALGCLACLLQIICEALK